MSNTVVFYPPMSNAGSSCGDGSAGTSCCGGAQSVDVNAVIGQLAEATREKFGDRVTVTVAGYGTRAEVEHAIEELNSALAADSKSYRLSALNFYTFLDSIAPLVLVNGRIANQRSLPSWDGLQSVINTSLVPA